MGANDITGMGANDITGMGANDITGMGANDITGMGADVPGLYANQRVLGAPIASEDGRVTIFNRLDALAGDTGTALLESLPTVPNRPDWLTPVGKTIRFVPSEAGQDIARIIEFGYLRREVPRGYEHTLKVYFSGDDGATWTPLPTDLDLDDAQATASADEEGLYVLGATVEIPLYSAGWNLFAYPIPAETSVAKALQNIEGMYTTMYGYDSKSPDDPWRIYNEDLPDWVSDVPDVSLDTLEYGQGYWIWVNGPLEEPLVLRLPVAEGRPLEAQAQPVAGQEAPTAKRMPPALYFGTLDASPEVVAAAGDAITAWIDLGSGARLCGIGSVVPGDAEGTYRYVVKVDAADQGTDAVCGAPGRTVSFKLGEESLPFSAPWDNSEPQAASLSQTGKTPPGPEPSPEPQFDSCRELVRNGGFEQSGSWTILGGPRRATYSTDQAAAGDRSLLLGGPPGEPLPYLGPDRRASAHQWISVPRTAGRVLLSFSYLPGNAGASDSTQRAMVLRPGDLNVVMSVLEDSAGWKSASAD
ncbi:MAG: hypothetical protein ACK2U9_05935, partial [Anaerolineae bacterium]